MASKREFCYLYLTCANTVETGQVSKALLEKRLVACTKQVGVSASYWDDGKIDQATEVLLIMESAMDLFEAVEKEVAKIHSYKTFVLEAVPIIKVSTNAEKWLNENLKNA